MEVLKSNGGRIETRELRRLRVVRWERQLNRRVIHSVVNSNVGIQRLEEHLAQSSQIGSITKRRTAIKSSRDGGHEQGILMATPCAFRIPSQSPVPVGLTPGCTPNCGTRAGSTPPVVAGAGALGATGAAGAGAGADGGGTVPAWIACACAPKVVAA